MTTPGPWRAWVNAFTGTSMWIEPVTADDHRKIVAWLPDGGAENEANAALLAAAPDLLAALEFVADRVLLLPDTAARVAAAIAAAHTLPTPRVWPAEGGQP